VPYVDLAAAPSLPRDEMSRSWRSWSEVADNSDEVELALELLDNVEDPSGHRHAATRARMVLMAGRPHEALALLREHDIVDLPPHLALSWPNLILAACRAAVGDAEAFQWLLAAASKVSGSPESAAVTYLVAVAAEGCGDQATADQAWSDIVTRYRIMTPMSLSHFGAALVAARDPLDPVAAAEAVTNAASAFDGLDPAVHEHPRLVLDAVANLRARGDDGGARLLLHAVIRCNPPSPALAAALCDLTPAAAMRRHRFKVVAAASLIVPLAPLGIIGGILAFAGRAVWERRVRLPGLTRAESGAWRAIRTYRYNAATDAVEHVEKEHTGVYGLAGLVAAFVALCVTAAPYEALARRVGEFDASTLHRIGWTSLALLTFLGPGAAAYFGARAAHRRLQARRRDRRNRVAERQRLALAARCQCWQAHGFSGAFAEAYLHRHLTQLTPDVVPVAPNLRGRLGRCPSTGALWLMTGVGASPALLLRGPVSEPIDESREAPDGLFL
jgi:hypothetical protein